MERNFKGIWISKKVWLSEKLTIQEKVFFVEIDSLDNEKGCFASNQYFAEFFGLSSRQVSRIINSLIDKKMIKSKTICIKQNSTRILTIIKNRVDRSV